MSNQNNRRDNYGRGKNNGNFKRGPRGSAQNSPRPKKKQGGGENIHFSRYIKPAKPVLVEEAYVAKHHFDDFAIDGLLKRNVAKKGIETPSPIQDQAIPHGLDGCDVVGIANTGTGKTLAFSIPVLNRILNDRTARALIVAPTRELAQQIEAEMKSIARNSGIFGAVLIGGANMNPQLLALMDDPELVIGTPGRIKDHIERGSLDLSKFNIVVLDEFDRMLDMGFVRDMRLIFSKLNDKRQNFFFSATLDKRVSDLVNEFANDPITISVKSGETTDNVDQNVVFYETKDDKLDKLHDLLIEDRTSKTLIFDATKYGADRLGKKLGQRGFNVESIHGGKTQGARQRALSQFKSNKISVLVATDVAARGIDIADVTHVVNYSEPQTYTDYVHRIGRAGRAGKSGFAYTFVER